MSAEFARALFAFLVLPGSVAFALPLWPFLARTHGDDWRRYRARVRRWL